MSPDGSVLAGLRILFLLTDREGNKIDIFDRVTGEKVAGQVEVRTNSLGIFEVELFPNTRGDKESFYLVHIIYKGFVDFKCQLQEDLIDDNTPLTFMEFRYGGEPINPIQMNLMQQYIDSLDTTVDGIIAGAQGVIEDAQQALIDVEEAIQSIENTIGTYPFEQTVPSDVWFIEHNLGRYPSLTILDEDGGLIDGVPVYNSNMQLTVLFSTPVAGVAYLN